MASQPAALEPGSHAGSGFSSTSYEIRRSVYDVLQHEGSSRSTLDTPPPRGGMADVDALALPLATSGIQSAAKTPEASGAAPSVADRRVVATSWSARSTSSGSRIRNEEVSKHCNDLEDVLLTLQTRRRGGKSSVKTSARSASVNTTRERTGLMSSTEHNESAFQVVDTVLVDKSLGVTLPKFNIAERTLIQESTSVVPRIERRTEVREVPRLEVQVVQKVLEVPRTEYIDKVVEVPEVHVVEKLVEVPRLQVEERVTHVPKVEYRERVRTIPKVDVQVVEKTVEVPKIHTVEKQVEVPQVQLVEKLVEVPQVQYVEKVVEVPHEVQVSKIMEVPKVQVQEIVRQVPKVQVVEVPRVRTAPPPAHVVVHPPQPVTVVPATTLRVQETAQVTPVAPLAPAVACRVSTIPAARQDLFSILDTNHDGVLTREEIRSAVEPQGIQAELSSASQMYSVGQSSIVEPVNTTIPAVSSSATWVRQPAMLPAAQCGGSCQVSAGTVSPGTSGGLYFPSVTPPPANVPSLTTMPPTVAASTLNAQGGGHVPVTSVQSWRRPEVF